MSQAARSADIYKLAEALRQASGDSSITTQDVLIDAAHDIKANMERDVPVRTGRLKQSISIQVRSHSVIIGPHTDYAAYVEYGTAPHVIRPKAGKKALSFTVGGKRVIVKSVNHPGTKPHPYVRPAFEQWADSLGEMVADANVKRLEQDYSQ